MGDQTTDDRDSKTIRKCAYCGHKLKDNQKRYCCKHCSSQALSRRHSVNPVHPTGQIPRNPRFDVFTDSEIIIKVNYETGEHINRLQEFWDRA